MRYMVNLFHDKAMRRYAYTQFIESDNKDDVKPSHRHFDYYTVEEDTELEQQTIFHASITHDYSDGYDCDHHDYVKTIYIMASSYKEGTEKLYAKFKEFKGSNSDYSLNRIYKDNRDPITILLSK